MSTLLKLLITGVTLFSCTERKTAGIYIDSLWKDWYDVDKFNLYGINLKLENEKAVFAAFKTLKFHKED